MSKKILLGSFIISVGLLSFVVKKERETSFDRTKKAQKVYAEFCSGCHGEKMEAFVDRKWKYGTTKDSIIRSISIGSPDFGMPAYKDAIKQKEIATIAEMMTEYIK